MHVKLFGILAEKAGGDTLEVKAADVDSLRREVRKHIPELDRLSFAVAVDRKLTQENLSLTGDEEVALLPPFAGG